MNQDELRTLCAESGESKFRAEQLFEWMYRHGVLSFESMSNIKQSFREYLDKNYILNTLDLEKKSISKNDKSIKILFKTYDGYFIETVSMIDNDRHTVCISSQVGCALDCDFCATGKLGLKRNLITGEIVDQLIFVRNEIKTPITTHIAGIAVLYKPTDIPAIIFDG